MPVVHLATACIEGSRVLPVTVEVDLQPGLPLFTVIGLPDKRIEEAKERVRAAIKNSGFTMPLGKITVNLAPSAVHKQGTGFDLAIALGVLAVSGQLRELPVGWIIGELSLDGSVQAYQQLVPLLVEAAKSGVVGCLIPAEQERWAGLVNCPVSGVSNLKEAARIQPFRQLPYLEPSYSPPETYLIDLITGQEAAKRALVIALAGRHNLLLTGPPGSGKTMLARAASELLPPLNLSEQLALAQLYGFASRSFPLDDLRPPFRAPQPSISRSALIGGGTPLTPGEVSLAHAGILFLDEFAEMSRPVRDSLRVPLQEKRVELVRGSIHYQFPAQCIVIAAQNPCPCGLAGVPGEKCRCTAGDLTRYAAAVAEPILDRFALSCPVPKLTTAEWAKKRPIPRGTMYSQQIQKVRSTPHPPLSAAAKTLLTASVDRLHLSGRALHSAEKVAQTIAVLDDFSMVREEHVAEALQYRHRRSMEP